MYRQVADAVLRDIQSAKYRPGQKLPSEAALVKRFDTSRITIGRALRELKNDNWVHGIAGSGNFVSAGSASANRLLFGLLIPNLGESEIFEPICQGLASAPEAREYALLWGHTVGPPADLETQALDLGRQFVKQKAAGVFFAPLELTPNKDAVNRRICSLLDDAHIPIVLLDRCILPFPHRSRYDLVGIDNRRAGYLATEHLLRSGSRHISFLALAGAAPTVEARIAGYREALLAPGTVHRLIAVTEDAVQQIMTEARSQAFVCANDRLAGQLMHALQELGYRVPQDVRVVGIDDVEYARLLPVPLTTVHQPCRAIGEAAITTMLHRLQHPDSATRDVLLACELIVRRSSA